MFFYHILKQNLYCQLLYFLFGPNTQHHPTNLTKTLVFKGTDDVDVDVESVSSNSATSYVSASVSESDKGFTYASSSRGGGGKVTLGGGGVSVDVKHSWLE